MCVCVCVCVCARARVEAFLCLLTPFFCVRMGVRARQMDIDAGGADEAETVALPVSAAPANVKVKEYDPKAKQAKPAAADPYLVSPLTGEQVLASKMAEHVRIQLLDPKWKEQKDRLVGGGGGGGGGGLRRARDGWSVS